MSGHIALQNAIYSKLQNDSTLSALVTGVYDDVEQVNASESRTAFPYVVIGDDSYNDWDTDTETGFDVVITVHIWSRYRGRKEVKQIQDAVYTALNRQSLSVSGYAVLDVLYLESESFVDADGETRHGIIKFNVKMEAV
ncbi:MAG: DUF3168 domain-containing protein [Chloroflexi bacterium]|nr:MAG: DUF3168 domain-containing protein [Chloroflexota bacterium]